MLTYEQFACIILFLFVMYWIGVYHGRTYQRNFDKKYMKKKED